MKVQELEKELEKIRNRRIPTLAPSTKHEVEALQEHTVALLENALQGARSVEAIQDLTQVLGAALRAILKHLEGTEKKVPKKRRVHNEGPIDGTETPLK